MAKIKQLKDISGEAISPLTDEKSVYDAAGTRLDVKLNAAVYVNGEAVDTTPPPTVTVDRAVADEDGNNIKETYATKSELTEATPTIGENGNWVVGGVDTNKPSKGADGKDGADGVSLGEIALVQELSTGSGSENKVVSQKVVSEKINELEVFQSELKNSIYSPVTNNIPLSIKLENGLNGCWKSSNGLWLEDDTRRGSDKIQVRQGEKYYITTTIGGSTVIAYVGQWNEDTWVGVPEGFTGGSGNAAEREYIVPEGVTHIAISSYNTTEPTLKKEVLIPDVYKKEHIDAIDSRLTVVEQLVTPKDTTKIYGVRNNLSDDTITKWERINDSIGMSASIQKGDVSADKDDFLNVYPYSEIKECNIEILSNGAKKIIYKGEEGFSLTDKDVFVEFPLWYERRFIKDGYEYRQICEQQLGGFYPSPMFVENGRVLDRVYIAKYETSIIDGKACSKSGVEPASYKTIAEFRDLYKAKGKGFAAMDIRTVMSLQHLYLVRFAEKNSQNYIGGGFTDIMQPWGFFAKDYSAPSGEGGKTESKNFVKTYRSASSVNDIIKGKFWVGKNIGFVKSNENMLYNRATITDIQITEDGKQATIYFDKEVEIIEEAEDAPVSNDATPVRTWFGGCGQDTGLTDKIVHDTGRTEFKSETQNNGTCGVKLFYIENMWGNLWHEIDGLIFKNGYAYIGFSQENYNNEATNYVSISYEMLNQQELGSVGSQFCFIGNLGLDNVYPWLAYPNKVRGGDPTDTSMPDSGITENNSYGDAYYFNNSLDSAIEVHGGGFDHYGRAGLFTHRCWNSIVTKWYLQGSRMQFKIL